MMKLLLRDDSDPDIRREYEVCTAQEIFDWISEHGREWHRFMGEAILDKIGEAQAVRQRLQDPPGKKIPIDVHDDVD